MQDPPFIAGVGGGVGTTTIAAALQGQDCGVYQAYKPVHVVVCRSTLHSLGCAQRALQYTPARTTTAGDPPPPPVLAIVDDVPNGGVAPNTANRLRMTEGYVSSIVRLPFVSDWRDVEAPYREAAALLVDPHEQPKGLRAFTDSVRELVDAIVSLVHTDTHAESRYATAAFAGR